MDFILVLTVAGGYFVMRSYCHPRSQAVPTSQLIHRLSRASYFEPNGNRGEGCSLGRKKKKISKCFIDCKGRGTERMQHPGTFWELAHCVHFNYIRGQITPVALWQWHWGRLPGSLTPAVTSNSIIRGAMAKMNGPSCRLTLIQSSSAFWGFLAVAQHASVFNQQPVTTQLKDLVSKPLWGLILTIFHKGRNFDSTEQTCVTSHEVIENFERRVRMRERREGKKWYDKNVRKK